MHATLRTTLLKIGLLRGRRAAGLSLSQRKAGGFTSVRGRFDIPARASEMVNRLQREGHRPPTLL